MSSPHGLHNVYCAWLYWFGVGSGGSLLPFICKDTKLCYALGSNVMPRTIVWSVFDIYTSHSVMELFRGALCSKIGHFKCIVIVCTCIAFASKTNKKTYIFTVSGRCYLISSLALYSFQLSLSPRSRLHTQVLVPFSLHDRFMNKRSIALHRLNIRLDDFFGR